MKVSIIGAAGTVGSCAAFAIAIQGLAEEILLVDTRENVLMNHVMDISAAVVGQYNIRVRGGGYEDMSGSEVIVIAAGVHLTGVPVKDRLAPNVPIIQGIARNIEKHCPEAVVITATNPVDLLNYTVYLSTNLERKKLIGYNLNDTIRFQMAVATTLGIDSTRVEAVAVGDHPGAPVQLFSSIKVDERPYDINPEVKKRLQEELRNYLKSFEALKAGRTAGWTSGAGIATIVRAVREDAGKLLSCSAVLDGEYGYHSLSMGVPAIIGKEGIRRIPDWKLPENERQDLDAVAQVLKSNCDYVRGLVGSNRP
jgi:malate dehydrogenase